MVASNQLLRPFMETAVTIRAAIGAVARQMVAAAEPWYDWGKVGVERMESLRPGQIATDGEVRFVELQWLGVHIGFQIGRTPKRRG